MASNLLRNRRFLTGLCALCLALAAGALAGLVRLRASTARTDAAAPGFAAPSGLSITLPNSLEATAAAFPTLAEFLRDPALDSVYKEFALEYQSRGPAAARALARARGLLDERDRVCVTLVLDAADAAPAVAAALVDTGVVVRGYYGNLLDVAVPLRLIEEIAASDDASQAASDDASQALATLRHLQHVVKLRVPLPTLADQGPSSPEGVESSGARAWHDVGITGEGVRVGILDLGFDGYRDLLGTALPSQVAARSFVLDHEPDETGSVHGTACAEIVHAMAPGSTLYLAYYDGSEVSMGHAVEWLLDQGVDIITHSATGMAAPMDGTGFQCELVAMAARQGVLWVNCAGNYGLSHHRANLTDSDGDGLHEFRTGGEVLAFRTIDRGILVALRWSDWATTTLDLDLHLYDATGALLASSRNRQTGSQGDLPFESIRYSDAPPGTYYLAVEAGAGGRNATIDVFVVNGEVEAAEPAYSLGTPADSPDALAVGASHWHTNEAEGFSSRGPTEDGRIKPDLTAPDAVSVRSYAGLFSGTSASAPHAAGAAALVLSADRGTTREQLVQMLTDNAGDYGASGPDNTYGHGVLRLPDPRTAYVAPTATAIAEVPPPVTATLAPATTATADATALVAQTRTVVAATATSTALTGATPPMLGATASAAAASLTPPAPTIVALATRATLAPVSRTMTEQDARLLSIALVLTMGIGVLGLAAGLVLLTSAARGGRRGGSPASRQRFTEPPEEPHLLLPDGSRALLAQGDNGIGRSADNAVVLAGRERVSRHHAIIAWDGGQAILIDLGSSNGTHVNGVRISANTPHTLRDGDVIDLGPTARLVARLPWT